MSVPRIGITGVVRSWDNSERTGVNADTCGPLGAGGLPVILSPLSGLTMRRTRPMDSMDFCSPAARTLTHRYTVSRVPPCSSRKLRARSLRAGGLAAASSARDSHYPPRHSSLSTSDSAVHCIRISRRSVRTRRCTMRLRRAGPSYPSRRSRAGTRVAAAVGAVTLQVNSIHHQGVKDLSPDLRAAGWADDLADRSGRKPGRPQLAAGGAVASGGNARRPAGAGWRSLPSARGGREASRSRETNPGSKARAEVAERAIG